MKKIIAITAFFAIYTYAHFGVMLSSQNVVKEQKNANITLTYAFMHPFEQNYMHLKLPEKAGVFSNNKIEDITKTLKKSGKTWKANYTLKKPSVYQFFFIPKPYFEKNEAKFIKHITKTVVDAFGAGEGWDTPVGLKAEIIPLTRPYGLYENSIFSAKVLFKGKPVKNCEVEVEFYNDKDFKAPSDDHITQVVKTDGNGVFHFVLSKAGWWGFSALLQDDKTLIHEGKNYPVELGAVMWIKTDEWQK